MNQYLYAPQINSHIIITYIGSRNIHPIDTNLVLIKYTVPETNTTYIDIIWN